MLINSFFSVRKPSLKPRKEENTFYRNLAPSIYIVKKCFAEFRCAHTVASDAERPECLKEAIKLQIFLIEPSKN